MGLHTSSVRGNDAATCLPSFVNLRKQILAVGSHRPHFCFPVSYIWETAISAWGYTTSVRETTRQLVAVVRQFAQANSCRKLPSPALLLSRQLHMGNGNFRMGLHYFVARNDAATCLPSFVNLRKQILAVVLRFTEVEKIRKGMQTETATSAWGDTTSLRGKKSATSFLYDKRFFRLNTI